MTTPSENQELERLEFTEKANIRAACARASRIYPPAIAELIRQELMTWEEMGYRFGGASLISRCIKTIMETPIPGNEPVTEPIRKMMPKPRIVAHTPLPVPPGLKTNATES